MNRITPAPSLYHCLPRKEVVLVRVGLDHTFLIYSNLLSRQLPPSPPPPSPMHTVVEPTYSLLVTKFSQYAEERAHVIYLLIVKVEIEREGREGNMNIHILRRKYENLRGQQKVLRINR